MNAPRQVHISIDMTGSVDLAVDEVWPDGDAPEHITAADVVALLERDHKARAMSDWCLLRDLDVTVHVHHVNPEWKSQAALPDMPPPALWTDSTRAEAWA